MDFGDQYLEYKEYTSMGGTLDKMPFSILEFEARKIVDKYTYGRLKDLDEQITEVKMCIFDLINQISTDSSITTNNVSNNNISSEHIDGYSVTYNKTTKEDIEVRENKNKSIVNDYLYDCKLDDGTPYLYRGANNVNEFKYNSLSQDI